MSGGDGVSLEADGSGESLMAGVSMAGGAGVSWKQVAVVNH